jgi:hypothetical protein
MRHINKEISIGHDTTGEALTTTIRKLLMEEVDVEGNYFVRLLKEPQRRISIGRPLRNQTKKFANTFLTTSNGWKASSSTQMAPNQYRKITLQLSCSLVSR